MIKRTTNPVKSASPVSKKMRFEVFKRDKFTCQYCGKSAPDVILHVDHIHPRSKGGKNDLLNLVTSCRDCNLGKGKRTLDDDAVVKRQQAQLTLIQERREQIKMLMEWQQSLINADDETVSELSKIWLMRAAPWQITESGAMQIRQWLKKFTATEIAEAIRISTSQYLRYDNENPNSPTKESANKAWDFVPRIVVGQKRQLDKPYLKDLYYLRGILKHRISYVNDWQALEALEKAYLAGKTIEELKAMVLAIKSWTAFKATIALLLDGDK